MTLKHRLENWWTSPAKPGFLARSALRVVSWGYGWPVRVRNWLHDQKEGKRVSPRVISVGNITLGGTGKTPLTIYLAQQLRDQGKKVAILSRGYRSRAEKRGEPLLVEPGVSWEDCGDEPYLMAQNLPGVDVIVCPDRFAGAKLAEERGAEVILLDDGFQHRQLERDTDIVVIDGKVPLSSLRLFPFGTLREPLSGLGRAHLIVVTHADGEMDLSRYTSAPVVGAIHQGQWIVDRQGLCHPSLEGIKVGLFCGIGKPDRFRATVEEMGGEVVDLLPLPDHIPPSPSELGAFADQCKDKGAELLLCTEKDWIKLPQGEVSLPIAYVKLGLTFTNPLDLKSL